MSQDQERQEAFRRVITQGVMEYPVLAFKVRRQHLLQDTLREVSSIGRCGPPSRLMMFSCS
jgi:hypothetical protein